MLEVFAESRLVVEVEVVGYLLYVAAGIAEQIFGFKYDKMVNPFGGGTAGGFFYD